MPSQNFQWLPVAPSGQTGAGGGVRHTTLRLVAGREGTGIWSRGECSVRRRMLQSEPVLHPNQRCGGCAARPSILHTKGHPPCPPRSPPRQPTSRNCGAVPKDRESGETDTQTGAERLSKFHPRSGTAPWRLKETETQSKQRHPQSAKGETDPEAGKRKEKGAFGKQREL